jgi:2-polyprenyl-3-methyl-5-hydroxy-6-metoxy-1,4-benzoquinol methylase
MSIEQKVSQLLLERRISDEFFDELRAACTAGWDPAFASSPLGMLASEEVVFRRHDRALRTIVPWISRHKNLAEVDIIDFGAGCGSSSLAFSHFARRVFSFEIDDASSQAFAKRMEMFRVGNVQFEQCPPETIFEAASYRIAPDSSIVLAAVVEHLLEIEQVTYLRSFWDRLAPGQLLIITETPNYFAFFDGHTFEKPFAHFIPDELFSGWLERHDPSLRFRDALIANPQGMLQQRRRLGLGVTPEPFQQAFGIDLRA